MMKDSTFSYCSFVLYPYCYTPLRVFWCTLKNFSSEFDRFSLFLRVGDVCDAIIRESRYWFDRFSLLFAICYDENELTTWNYRNALWRAAM